MAIFTIAHTATSGTTLDGSSRGDGTAEIAKSHGLRWSRTASLWYLPRTRDTTPNQGSIENLARALRARGDDVELDIDATQRDVGDAEADREERAEERAARLTSRAERHERASQGRRGSADRISSSRPAGQPILIGHHSEAKAWNDQRRLEGHLTAAMEHTEQAATAAEAARAAAAHMDDRYAPGVVARRIEKLEATGRQLTARMERTGHYVTYGPPAPSDLRHLTDLLESNARALAHWKATRQEQLAQGRAQDYGPHTISAGDRIRVRGAWHLVKRANAKTVTVATGDGWDDRIPYSHLAGHQAAG